MDARRGAAWAGAALVWALGGPGAAGCRDGAPPPLRVLAAASTRAPLEAVARAFEAETGVPVQASFGASSALARQVDAGAPADVYLAADPAWLGWLDARGRLAPGTARDVAGNALVLVAPRARPFAWAPGAPLAAAFEGRLVVGDPEHVPVGRYAREALTALGQWDALAGRLAPAGDAGAAVAHVALGTAGAGVVYASDAAGQADLVVVARLPAGTHRPIRYRAALVAPASGAAAHPAAAAFLDALAGPAGRTAFARAGFAPPEAPSSGAPAPGVPPSGAPAPEGAPP